MANHARNVAAHALGSSFNIGFVTDLEGDLVHWRRYLAMSKAFEPQTQQPLAPSGPAATAIASGAGSGPPGGGALPLPALREGFHFVYGGDAVDKGGADLAVLEDLLALKKRYPGRVHLLLGNRDINKMRFLHELANPHTCSVKEHPGAYWIRADAQKPAAWTEAANNAGGKQQPESDRAAIAEWMLKVTMGCPDTFELRRAELAARRLSKEKKAGHGSDDAATPRVSDDEVAADFLRSVLPGGQQAEYLANADLMVVLGDVAFVHGAVWEGCLGAVPRFVSRAASGKAGGRGDVEEADFLVPTTSTRDGAAVHWDRLDLKAHPKARLEGSPSLLTPAEAWAAELQEFKRAEVGRFLKAGQHLLDGRGQLAWSAHPWAGTGGYTGDAGAALMQYGMGWAADQERIPSPIYANYLRDGGPAPVAAAVRESLVASGVSHVVSGHQPFADGPLVISSGGLRVITADTSYSNNTKWEPPLGLSETSLEKAGGNKAGGHTAGAGNTGASLEVGNGTRGCAVCEVVLELGELDEENPGMDGVSNGENDFGRRRLVVRKANLHGTLSNGDPYDFSLPGLHSGSRRGAGGGGDEIEGDPPPVVSAESGVPPTSAESLGAWLVGREIYDGWWARAVLPNGQILLSHGQGFTHKNRVCDPLWARDQALLNSGALQK